ncbi:hypothetical protein J3B00_002554 [Pseudomonas sp. BP8]|nr:hypothetical protein [Pseudomonas sp. BP8]
MPRETGEAGAIHHGGRSGLFAGQARSYKVLPLPQSLNYTLSCIPTRNEIYKNYRFQ